MSPSSPSALSVSPGAVAAPRQYGRVIVLHAAWLTGSGRLALWAEGGNRGTTPGPRRRPARRIPPHPFALDPEGLRLAVSDIAGMAAADLLGEDVQLTLQLPDAGGVPIAFPLDDELPGPTPGGSAASSSSWEDLSLWTCPGVCSRAPYVPRSSSARCPCREEATGPSPTRDPRMSNWGPISVSLPTRSRWWSNSSPGAGCCPISSSSLVIGGPAGAPSSTVTTAVGSRRWRGPCRPRSPRYACPSRTPTTAFAQLGPEPSDEVLRSLMWAVTDALARDLITPATPKARRRGAGATVVDAWLRALGSPDGSLHGCERRRVCATRRTACGVARHEERRGRSGTDLFSDRPTSRRGRRGSRPGGRARSSEEAKGQPRQIRSPTWRIDFALQAVDDPSLVVSADDVWSDGPELTAIGRHVMHPDEHLLRGLGQAARLVPSLGKTLSSATPCAYTTDAAGILTFLREGAPLLEEAGFGVLAPPWWRSSRTRLGLRLKARTSSKGGTSTGTIGLDGLCDIRWEAVLGDDTLSLTELRQLARLKQPLVRVRGQWVELHHGELSAAITAVGKRGAAGDVLSAGEVLRSALGLEHGPGDLPVVEVAADGWLGDVLSGAEDRKLEPTPTPDGFAGELRPYQERGLAWLSFLGELGLGACLADDMGLGKTAQLLALLVDERARAALAPIVRPRSAASETARRTTQRRLGPTLVLCPMSLVGNWQREAARFAPKLAVYVHHGAGPSYGQGIHQACGQGGPGPVDLWSRHAGRGVAGQRSLAPAGSRRGTTDQEQCRPHDAERAVDSGRAADRHDRHTGRESTERAVVDHGVPQPRHPRLRAEVPRTLRRPDRARG